MPREDNDLSGFGPEIRQAMVGVFGEEVVAQMERDHVDHERNQLRRYRRYRIVMNLISVIMGLLVCATWWAMISFHNSLDNKRPGAGRIGGIQYVGADEQGKKYVYTQEYIQESFEATLARLKDAEVKHGLEEFVPQFKLRRDDPKRFFFLELALGRWAYESAYGYREDGRTKVVLGIERESKMLSEPTPEVLEQQESALVHEYSHLRDYLDGHCENILTENSWPSDKNSLTPADREVYLEGRCEQLATEVRAYLASCRYTLTYYPELAVQERTESKYFDQLCANYQAQDWEAFCLTIYQEYSEHPWKDARQHNQYADQIPETEERDYVLRSMKERLIPNLTHEP